MRLAPLYDVASALPYPDMHVRRLRFAIKLGGDYRERGRERAGEGGHLRVASGVRECVGRSLRELVGPR